MVMILVNVGWHVLKWCWVQYHVVECLWLWVNVLVVHDGRYVSVVELSGWKIIHVESC